MMATCPNLLRTVCSRFKPDIKLYWSDFVWTQINYQCSKCQCRTYSCMSESYNTIGSVNNWFQWLLLVTRRQEWICSWPEGSGSFLLIFLACFFWPGGFLLCVLPPGRNGGHQHHRLREWGWATRKLPSHPICFSSRNPQSLLLSTLPMLIPAKMHGMFCVLQKYPPPSIACILTAHERVRKHYLQRRLILLFPLLFDWQSGSQWC